jgi:hypothetical protein
VEDWVKEAARQIVNEIDARGDALLRFVNDGDGRMDYMGLRGAVQLEADIASIIVACAQSTIVET